MGTSSYAIPDCWSVQAFRNLLSSFGIRFTGHQQRLVVVDLHSHFPYRETMLWRTSRCGLGLDMGLHALRDLLVHEMGLGDEPVRLVDRNHFLACDQHGRARWLGAMDTVRTPVGNRGAEQPRVAFISPCLRPVRMVSTLEAW